MEAGESPGAIYVAAEFQMSSYCDLDLDCLWLTNGSPFEAGEGAIYQSSLDAECLL